ncbi:hypothetical protein FEM48_Zijuj09G0217200 [Ziziphus jujuba var. spinosa]|uniref:Leucine-rich repeat-containing N-terminal plant-type domain-containing protein n=1 Tax=Ziziphus jujuba var. spinosa TaxID=714518 RepID=A0A978UVH2_ZIZJJ|nr:hypothetical protein FEM48_Zijuj09G0217200 [Ziziphus jujuba var. spinosa]
MKHSNTFINGKCFFIFLCGILFLTKLSFSIGELEVACRDAERKALDKFKRGLADPSGRLSSWVGDDCCRWEGVSCNNRTGHVVELNLRSPSSNSLDGDGTVQTLSGKIDPSLIVLKDLNYLDLSKIDFGGEITDVLDSLSRCSRSSLKTLNLGYNELTGNLPNSLGYLKSLTYLQMSDNLFQGSLPNSIGNLTSLEEISLSSNILSGIPKSLGQLSKLTVLDISENIWEGVITETHLANLSSLTELTMDKVSPNISLVFKINSDWIPPFKLTYLLIRSCQLGPKFPTWLKNQSELTFVILNNAMISDTIPNWFLNLDLRLGRLEMAYNQLSGKVPNSFSFNKESIVDLSTNRFQGPLPIWSSNITIFSLRDNLFSGPIPPNIGEAMPLLSDLDISENSLSGSIPLSIGNLTGLTTLIISNNKLSGIDEITYQGKLKVVAKGRALLYDSTLYLFNSIDLSNNNLSGGQIPSSVGNLEWIETLDISMNHISGPIPLSMTSLIFLNHLNLSYNNLSGKIPTTNQFLTFDAHQSTKEMLATITSMVGQTTSSPSNIQLLWLLSLCGIIIAFFNGRCFGDGDRGMDCIDEEWKVLLHFTDCLTNPSGRLSSWVGLDFCEWEGVYC